MTRARVVGGRSMKKSRTKNSPAFKPKVALAVLRERSSVSARKTPGS
jgi:hypothetical protein